MSIFFSALICCCEVTAMGKRVRRKWDLPAGRTQALLVLCAALIRLYDLTHVQQRQ